jgi:hypothetical protein
MGYSDWSDAAYKSVSAGRASASGAEIFRGERSVDPLMDPKLLRMREARDSEHHPNSVPIIVAFDVTGSMGDIPTRFAQQMLGHLMKRLVEGGWVTDPQVLMAAIGDAESDSGPLQIGQFESGLEMDMWLTRLWLEGRGGDLPESYTLAHWFAAHHTSTDAWEKRAAKGYLFTIGDAPNKPLNAAQIERVFGRPATHPATDAAAVAAAAERYELFHILVTRGAAPDASLLAHWTGLIGDRVLVLDHTEAICELMGVVLGLREGSLKAADARRLLAAAGMGADPIERAIRSAS